jgi:hypothetical protein
MPAARPTAKAAIHCSLVILCPAATVPFATRSLPMRVRPRRSQRPTGRPTSRRGDRLHRRAKPILTGPGGVAVSDRNELAKSRLAGSAAAFRAHARAAHSAERAIGPDFTGGSLIKSLASDQMRELGLKVKGPKAPSREWSKTGRARPWDLRTADLFGA